MLGETAKGRGTRTEDRVDAHVIKIKKLVYAGRGRGSLRRTVCSESDGEAYGGASLGMTERDGLPE